MTPASRPDPLAGQAPRENESRWGGPPTILALVLLGAAGLRLVGVEYGLPHRNLLNPDEQAIVPRAWGVANGAGLDPHPLFDHPSLLLYVLAPAQWWQPEPSWLAARLAVVAIGVVGVAAAWWLGSRAYGVVAGGVAAAVTAVAGVHVAHSRMAVTDVLLTTLVTVSLALLVSGRIELAGLVAGFAAAAKYPGALALVPILAVAWGAWRRVAFSAALAAAGFAAASPFVLAHPLEAGGDLRRAASQAQQGSLGFENDPFAAIAFAVRLWESLGPGLLVAVVGLAVALAVRAPADRALAAFALVWFASLLPLGSHFDRYVLPLVPVLGVLAGRFRAFAPVTLLLLVVPLTWTVRDTRELTKPDTRAVALERVERAVGDVALTVDPGLPLPELPAVVQVALPAPWAAFDRRRRTDLPGFVWVNGEVADRVRASRVDYPEEAAFYDALERDARLVFRLEPGDRLAGPWTALWEVPSGR